jgi:hypothetical protein
MKKLSKPAPAIDPARRHAVIYARVSSKEQEKEGFSVPAQLKLLKEYAVANGFMVKQPPREAAFFAPVFGPRAGSLFCEDYENRDERAEDHDGLETDRAYDPF